MAVLIQQSQDERVAFIRLVPRPLDLQRDGVGRRPRPRHRPAAADDVELAVHRLRRIGEHHGYFHRASDDRGRARRVSKSAAPPLQEVQLMKPFALVGILLIVLGVVALAYQGITYTTNDKVVDLGPLKVEKKEEKTIPLPPIVGGVALVAGIVLLIASSRGRA